MEDQNSQQKPEIKGPSVPGASTAARFGLQKGIEKGVAATATRMAAMKGVAAAAGTALGGPVGTIVASGVTTGIIGIKNHAHKIVLGIGTGIGSTASAIAAGVGAVIGAAVTGVAITIGIAAITIPLLIAFIMFIINSGAYVVPYSAQGIGNIGPIVLTEGCPQGWPVRANSVITQGPYTGGSHRGYEAIDIGVRTNTPVYATHPGVVVKLFNPEDKSSAGGYKIRIASLCNEVEFYSTYLHLLSSPVQQGQRVNAGDLIAYSDNTGSLTTGAHLHYEFVLGSAVGAGRSAGYPNNPPFMMPPFIPKSIPRGCSGAGSCGVSIP